MSRRSSPAPALWLLTACVLGLAACGEQIPGGMPAEAQSQTAAGQAATEQPATDQIGGDQGAGDQTGAGPGAIGPAAGSDADDPIVVKIGEDEFLTNMAIYRRYDDAKETALALGAPVAPAEVLEGGKKQDFADGAIYWSPQTGAQIVRGQILATYLDNGGPAGRLGWPVSDELVEDEVIYSDFQRGQIRLEDQAIRVVEHSG
ncbi:LGFP repeat-containing protein [Dietzia maris]|uniref:LGFP repeat-containing protein n=1 Tax=Dietzia maris TaxID=37915 RepID=UPI0037C6C27A